MQTANHSTLQQEDNQQEQRWEAQGGSSRASAQRRVQLLATQLAAGERGGSASSSSSNQANTFSQVGSAPSPSDVVIVEAIRTPIGRGKRGSFKDTTPDVLLSAAIKGLLERTRVPADAVGEVCVGNVLQPGAMAAGARMAQLVAGMPASVPLSTVNRQCSSGLQAVAHIASGIACGYYDVGIAAGVESMSLTSMSGPKPQVDWDAVKTSAAACECTLPMGITSENVAAKYGISREQQDAFSVQSHVKAAAAQSNGKFDAEIIPVATRVKDKDGNMVDVLVRQDEGIRAKSTVQSLGKLKAVFKKGGSTTAGNSSQVSDGAAAALLMTRSRAEELGMPVLGVFRGFAVRGVPPAIMGIGPAVAIPAVLEQVGLSMDDVDIFEINEAFASQATYCIKHLDIPAEKVNPNGGAIALGHPLGCTGCRQLATLLYELKRTGQRVGVVSMCIGTGMGAAAVIEAP